MAARVEATFAGQAPFQTDPAAVLAGGQRRGLVGVTGRGGHGDHHPSVHADGVPRSGSPPMGCRRLVLDDQPGLPQVVDTNDHVADERVGGQRPVVADLHRPEPSQGDRQRPAWARFGHDPVSRCWSATALGLPTDRPRPVDRAEPWWRRASMSATGPQVPVPTGMASVRAAPDEPLEGGGQGRAPKGLPSRHRRRTADRQMETASASTLSGSGIGRPSSARPCR